MPWFIGIALYVVLWWLVIFTVLPFGAQPAEKREPGHDAGAPAQPRLKLKAAVTTVLAGVIWVAIYWAVTHDLVSFRGST